MKPILIKPYTDKYHIDKEMFYLDLCNIYKDKGIPIELGSLGVPEAAYISLLDLPIVDIKDFTVKELDKTLFSFTRTPDMDVIIGAINGSLHGFFLLKSGEDYFYNQYKRNNWLQRCVSIPITNFVKYYREKKLEFLFEDDLDIV